MLGTPRRSRRSVGGWFFAVLDFFFFFYLLPVENIAGQELMERGELKLLLLGSMFGAPGQISLISYR